MQGVVLYAASDVKGLQEVLDRELPLLQGDGLTILDVAVIETVVDKGYLAVVRYDDPEEA